jgi:hypothetical protein
MWSFYIPLARFHVTLIDNGCIAGASYDMTAALDFEWLSSKLIVHILRLNH